MLLHKDVPKNLPVPLSRAEDPGDPEHLTQAEERAGPMLQLLEGISFFLGQPLGGWILRPN